MRFNTKIKSVVSGSKYVDIVSNKNLIYNDALEIEDKTSNGETKRCVSIKSNRRGLIVFNEKCRGKECYPKACYSSINDEKTSIICLKDGIKDIEYLHHGLIKRNYK